MKKSVIYFEEKELIENCRKDVNAYKKLVEGLNHIEVIKKKDGKPFASLNRNFKNVHIYDSYIVVYWSTNNNPIRDSETYYLDTSDFDTIMKGIETNKERYELELEAYTKALNLLESGQCELVNDIKALRDKYNSTTKDSCKVKGNYNDVAYALHYLLWEYLY